jgi:hypothetical protein
MDWPMYAEGDRVWYIDGLPIVCLGTVENCCQHPDEPSEGAILVRWDDGGTAIDGFRMMDPTQIEPADTAPERADIPDTVPENIEDLDDYGTF